MPKLDLSPEEEGNDEQQQETQHSNVESKEDKTEGKRGEEGSSYVQL